METLTAAPGRLEELLEDVLSREEDLLEFYDLALGLTGADARAVLADVRRRHGECVEQLRRFQEELVVQRELTGAIAD